MIYFLAFCIVCFLHVLLKLQPISTLVVLIFALCMVPLHRKRYLLSKEYEERFYEVSLYLDTLLYSFVKEEKVELAVRDVVQTLPPNKLQQLASYGLEYMRMTFDKTEVMERALGFVEEQYPCKRIEDVHQFMVHVEYYGGEIEKPVNLLLKDKYRWERRIKETISERKKQLVDVILSVIASLVICGAILYIPVMDLDISGNVLVQFFSLLVILANDLIILGAQKFLCQDWIQLKVTEEESYYVKKMEDFRNYEEEKDKKLSLICGVGGLVAVAIALAFGNEWLVVAFLFLSLFLFEQHKIGRNLAKKNLVRQIKYAFPNWLLDLVLLLQSENVQVAMQKSLVHVPGVLKVELEELLNRLEMDPESSEPYHKFLQDFHIPEVNSAMGILYSLSIGNSSNGDRQMSELVEKNLELLDVTESKMLKDSSAGLYALFLLPVVVASFKLVMDMTIMIMQFIQIPVV